MPIFGFNMEPLSKIKSLVKKFIVNPSLFDHHYKNLNNEELSKHQFFLSCPSLLVLKNVTDLTKYKVMD